MRHDLGYPEQYASDNVSSSNGKLVHKPMLENNEKVVWGLAVEHKPWISYRGVNLASEDLKRISL